MATDALRAMRWITRLTAVLTGLLFVSVVAARAVGQTVSRAPQIIQHQVNQKLAVERIRTAEVRDLR
ncbi:MAG: hypothetical protein AAFR56_14260, partial [Chloroflexota bacterium]